MLRTKASQSIEFKTICAAEGTKSFRFELDSERNGSKSVFVPGDDAYLRLFPGGLNPSLWSNLGTVTKVTTDTLPITEYIVISRSQSGSLRYVPYGGVNWSWVGKTKGSGSPVFDEDHINLPQEMSGVLKCSYTARYDVLKLYNANTGVVLIEAETADRFGYTSVNYDSDSEIREVTLTVKDACSRAILPGANVWIDGELAGITNNQGKITLKLSVGNHTIKTTKASYVSSDKDTIKNDSFTVPSKE